jgi:DNA polymerase/3'-5' exonuclease PolX
LNASRHAAKVFAGVTDLRSLLAAVADGRISKVNGFGPAMIEKIKLYGEKTAKAKRWGGVADR